MEAMDIFLATTKEVSYLILNYPLYSSFGAFVLFVSLLRFYCRLTLGVCDCDQDMTDKTVFITGASSGIGKSTAYDMAERNARVVLGCRNMEKANKVAEEIKVSTGNQNVYVKCLDLTSFESVRTCAADILKTEEKLHVLINNAGISGAAQNEITKDGCEKTMQSNHLGHFLLTGLLLDLLKKSAPSRIVNVSSAVYPFAKLDVNDLANKKETNGFNVYANSKLANILFTRELAHRLANTGVTVNALHPGMVKTDIIQEKKEVLPRLTKLLFTLLGKTCDEGAQTTIYLAVHPEVEKTTGKYFSDCKEEPLKGKATDRTLATQLFEMSERIVGITFSPT